MTTTQTTPRGRKYAAGGWSVETVELDMVPRCKERGEGILGWNQPDHDGPWLLVKGRGLVYWVEAPEPGADPWDLVATLESLGVPAADGLQLVREW